MIMMPSITILSQSYRRVTWLLKLSQRGNKSNIQTFFNHYTYDHDQNFLSHASHDPVSQEKCEKITEALVEACQATQIEDLEIMKTLYGMKNIL